jgi:alginate O-acetyltransferase complex protein AlgI
VLPIGVSFFTFQSMSYTIDVYRGELRASRKFFDFALFVSFFPHLVAGPIMRAAVLLPQVLKPRHTTPEQISSGIHLIIWGMWKKVYVADNLSPVVDAIFKSSSPSGFDVLVGIYAFAFQIYCDFSGYTDIARGVARLLGFELGLNFNLPYFARNPQEFWSRWHISLSTWLRNYLYIPLGGNRHGERRTYRNLLLTMLLGGLWHGAAWTFIIWGAYQGALLAIHRWFSSRFNAAAGNAVTLSRLRFWISVVVMFQFTCIGWLIFRAASLEQLAAMSTTLLHPLDTLNWSQVSQLLPYVVPLIIVQVAQLFTGNMEFMTARTIPLPIRTAAYSVMTYLILFKASAPQSFIYFQF